MPNNSNIPTEDTQSLQNVASGAAYNKTTAQKIKSKIGFAIRTKYKEATKVAASYAIGMIPIVGSELAVVVDIAVRKVEEKYKEHKVHELQDKNKGNLLEQENLLAELKNFSFSNYLKEIDESYKKMRMSMVQLNNEQHKEFLNCNDYTEAFYQFYRVTDRTVKVLEKVQILKDFLTEFEKLVHQEYETAYYFYEAVTEKSNEYCEKHPQKICNHKSEHFSSLCVKNAAQGCS